ncbi:tyrosine-type recombinase/integrase [Methanosarcina sp. T3]|uniref:tyrosine-type recombinase/integrase n=1 Tax=Methanosarcina sp. T3 TaxID=3439062 RepID=UPI003F824C0D
MVNVDDIHGFDLRYIQALRKLRELETDPYNKELIENFVAACRREGIAKSTIIGYVEHAKRMIERLSEIGITKTLDKVDSNDFDKLLLYLEDEYPGRYKGQKGLSKNSLRNYKKFMKKFHRWLGDGTQPDWVQKLQLEAIETPVQPSDLLTKEEFNKLLDTCRHPRDKALIAAIADSGMRVGALTSCRIKDLVFNQYGATIYISKTSKSRKTTKPKGIPLTWSTGFLNQWLSVHPDKENPEAPLWVQKNKSEAISYPAVRNMLVRLGDRAGIKKPVNPHSFRHLAITNWILDGYNEQEVKHRAGWSKGSQQMLRIYANFTDEEMNDRIYEKCGLKTEDKRQVTLKKCPRCGNVLRPEDRFCSQCSLVLDREAADKIQAIKEGFSDKLQIDPTQMFTFMEEVKRFMDNGRSTNVT